MADEATKPEKKPARRRQGPRRSESSRAAILEATREELAAAGWRKFSVDSVARRAHASKQTIYRWWPATGNMCIEAALDLIQPVTAGTSTDTIDRLSILLQPLEACTRVGNGHAVLRGALMAAADDKDAGESWRNWMRSNIRAPLRLILAELAAKHTVRRDYDIDEAVNLLIAPAWHNMLIMRAPLKEGFAREQATRLLKVLAPA